jgi:hypothetical protein
MERGRRFLRGKKASYEMMHDLKMLSTCTMEEMRRCRCGVLLIHEVRIEIRGCRCGALVIRVDGRKQSTIR